MGHEQDCHAPFGVRFTDQPIKDLAALAVKPVGGLIQYKQTRVAHQGAGQAHTLKLSSRKLTDEVTHEASHADPLERRHAALVALFTANLPCARVLARIDQLRHACGKARDGLGEKLRDVADARPVAKACGILAKELDGAGRGHDLPDHEPGDG